MIVTGIRRRSTCHGQASGLTEAAQAARRRRGLAQVTFTAEDVVRHELVARIVEAYEGLPQKPATAKP